VSDNYNISINVSSEVNNAVSQIQQLENALKKFQNVNTNQKTGTQQLQNTYSKTREVSSAQKEQLSIQKEKNKLISQETSYLNSVVNNSRSGISISEKELKTVNSRVDAQQNIIKTIGKENGLSISTLTALNRNKAAAEKYNSVKEAGLLTSAKETINLQKTAAAMYAMQNASQGLGAVYEKIITPIETAMNYAVQWQDNMAQVARNYSATSDNFNLEEATSQLKNITSAIAVSVEEVSQIAATGGQLGVAADQMGDFTKAVAMFDDVTGVAAEQSAQSMGRIVNLGYEYVKVGDEMKRVDLSSQADSYLRVANTLTQLDLSANATASEIIEMGEQMIPIGRNYGYTADQVLALTTALSSVGIQAELGRSAFLRTNIAIEKVAREGGDKLLELQRITGMTGEQINQSLGSNTQAVFQAFITGLKNGVQEGQSVASNMEAIGINAIRNGQALTALVANYEQYTSLLSLAADELRNYDKIQQQLEARNNTVDRQMTLLTSNLSRVSASILDLGGATGLTTNILKLLNSVIEGISNVFENGSGISRFAAELLILGTVAGAGAIKIGQMYSSLISSALSIQFMVSYLSKASMSWQELLKHPVASLKSLSTANTEATTSNIALAKSNNEVAITGNFADGTMKKQTLSTKGLDNATNNATKSTKGFIAGWKALSTGMKISSVVGAALTAFSVISFVVDAIISSTKRVDEGNTLERQLERQKAAALDLSSALEQDRETYERTGKALAIYATTADTTADSSSDLADNSDAVASNIDKAGDSAEKATPKVVAYGNATKEALAKQLTNNVEPDENKSQYNSVDILKSFDGTKKAIDGTAFSYKHFVDLLNTTSFENAIAYAKTYIGDLNEMKNTLLAAGQSARVTATDVKNIGNRAIITSIGDIDKLDVLNLKLSDIQAKREEINKSPFYSAEQKQKATNALNELETRFNQYGITGDTTFNKISNASAMLTEYLRNEQKEIQKTKEVTELLGESADTVAGKMSVLKKAAEGSLSETQDTKKINSGLQSIADNAYKAANGLADFSDADSYLESTKQLVTDLYKVFEGDPTQVMAGVINGLDAMAQSGITSGQSVDYLFNQVSLLAGTLNSSYGLDIDVSAANGNIDLLKANIVDAINKKLALLGAVDTKQSIQLIEMKRNIENSQIKTQLMATKAMQNNTKATGGNTAAKKDNNKEAEKEKRTITDLISDLKKLTSSYNEFKFGVMEAWEKVSETYENARDDMADVVKDIDNLIDDMIKKLYGRQTAKDSINERLIDLRERIADAKEKWKELNATLNQQRANESELRYWLKVAQAVGDVAEEQRILAELEKNAVDQDKTKKDMSKASGEINMSLVGDDKQNIENRADVIELAKAYAEYVALLAETGASQEQINQAQKQAKADFLSSAEAIGFNSDELKEYGRLFDEILIATKNSDTIQNDKNKAMREAMEAEQEYISSLINSGASQQEVNKAMSDGVNRLRQLGKDLGLNNSQINQFVLGLTDVTRLLNALPPVNFQLALEPAQRAIDDFFAHLRTEAASAGADAGGSVGGGIAGGLGNLNEYYEKIREKEQERLDAFLNNSTVIQAADTKTKNQLVGDLLTIATSTELSTEQIGSAWSHAYSRIRDDDHNGKLQLVRSAGEIANKYGLTSEQGKAAFNSLFSEAVKNGDDVMLTGLINQADKIATKEGWTTGETAKYYKDMAKAVATDGDKEMAQKLDGYANWITTKFGEQSKASAKKYKDSFTAIDWQSLGFSDSSFYAKGWNTLNPSAQDWLTKINVKAGSSMTGTDWTGNGPINEPAGIYHRQEAVIQAPYAKMFSSEIQAMRRGIPPNPLTISNNNGGITYEQIAGLIQAEIQAILSSKTVVLDVNSLSDSQRQIMTRNRVGANV
jgi:hypothetical protein